MSKVKKYIEDASRAAVADELKLNKVSVANCEFDSSVSISVDNGDLVGVLLALAKAQSDIAMAVVEVSKSKPSINNNAVCLKINGGGNE